MYAILDDKQLRWAYMDLITFRDFGYTDYLKEVKEGIRKYHARKVQPRRIIKEYGIDGFVELEQLEDALDDWDKKDVDWWFRNNRYIECRPSLYDCSGNPFTSWYKLVRRRGHWYAYHSIAFDV